MISKSFKIYAFGLAFWLSTHCSYGQKYSIMVKPVSALESIFSISFERQVYKNFSFVITGEYINAPKLFQKTFQDAVQTGMGLAAAPIIKIEGFGIVPEIRYYFKQIDEREVDKVYLNEKKVMGWFVGAYMPIRHYNWVQLDIRSAEFFANAYQKDFGSTVLTDKLSLGAGLEGGKHWVWGNFSFEMLVGFAITSGVGRTAEFEFNRPVIGDYKVTKDLGYFANFMQFNPRLGINLGLAF
jgi:hypothetical protein